MGPTAIIPERHWHGSLPNTAKVLTCICKGVLLQSIECICRSSGCHRQNWQKKDCIVLSIEEIVFICFFYVGKFANLSRLIR